MRNIIGICGPKGSGKTTAAKALQDIGFFRMAFADPLKEALKIMCLFSDEQMYGSQEVKQTVDERWGFTPRYAMQQLGTEFGRDVLGEDHWIKHLLFRVKALSQIDPEHPIVIEDVRFVNEADAIHALGGRVIGVLPYYSDKEVEQDMHRSEAQMMSQFDNMCDLTICNVASYLQNANTLEEFNSNVYEAANYPLNELGKGVQKTFSIGDLREVF